MTTGQRGRPGDPARAVSIPARHMQDSSPLPDPARLSLLDVVQLATLGMRSRPLRAVLSILGVAVGMATLVLVVAIPQSGNAALLAKFTALGSNLLTSKPRHRRCSRGGGTAPERPGGVLPSRCGRHGRPHRAGHRSR